MNFCFIFKMTKRCCYFVVFMSYVVVLGVFRNNFLIRFDNQEAKNNNKLILSRQEEEGFVLFDICLHLQSLFCQNLFNENVS